MIEPLIVKYTASWQSVGNFKYVCLNEEQKDNMICVHQNDYIESWDLSRLPVRMTVPERDLTCEKYSMFCHLVSQVNWFANGSRPDIRFSMIDLSTKFNNAHKTHLVKSYQSYETDQGRKCVPETKVVRN